jgi:hypothetical protein
VLLIAGCASNDYPARRVETPVNVTHEVAFGDYRRVYNTTYHIVNRYGVIQTASYRYGEITALVSEDVSLFDKTRRTILARIFPREDYYEVECHVLIAVEDGDVKVFPDQFQREYSWKRIARDAGCEARLNNEIRAALSGGAWEAKEPLTPKPRQPASDEPGRKKARTQGQEEPTDEVRLVPRSREQTARGGEAAVPAEAFARAGAASLLAGAPERAEQACRAALEQDPRDPFAPWLLVHALFAEGKLSEAGAALDRAMEANPAWLNSQIAMQELHGKPVETAALQAQAQRQPALLGLLAYVRWAEGDPQAALAACDRRLEGGADPTAEVLRTRVVALLERTQGLEEF